MTLLDVRPTRRAMLGAAACGLAAMALAPARLRAARPQPGTPRALVFDGDALLATADSLRRSTDGGATWAALPAAPAGISALAAHADRRGRIFAGLAAGGVSLSEDGGESWADAAAGLPAAPVRALALAAESPDTVYAAVGGDGLWTSRDAGRSWELSMDRPWLDGAERDVLALASVSLDTGMGGIWVYAGTEIGLMRVPDCFCRWQEVRPGNAMDALVAGEAPPEAVPLPAGEPVRSLAVSPARPELLHAALPSGVWRSADAGVTWGRASATDVLCIAADPADPLHIVAATPGGLVTSRDGGLTWTAPGA